MTTTPNAGRLHIVIIGNCNTGKSTLFNTILRQDAALVSDQPGTTTDTVSRAMELSPIGSIVLIDTAGLNDTSILGKERVARTMQAIQKADIVIYLAREIDRQLPPSDLLDALQERGVPVMHVINSCTQVSPTVIDGYISVNALTGEGLDGLMAAIEKAAPNVIEPSLTAHLVKPQDIVLLVMPQDKQAPKGRLILPQQQVLRDLLENQCVAIAIQPDELSYTLVKVTPALVITDSQIFKFVRQAVPLSVPLTSFSILMARAKGDINLFIEGAEAIAYLAPGDRILIAESCTHNPQDGDIGRVKIPALLNKKVGGELCYDFAVGSDFPDDLTIYKLVIMCGGCMFNRRHMLSRLEKLKNLKIPTTNYGVAIATLQGVIKEIVF